MTFADRYWTSPDGLRLHYRDYDGPREGPPLLCLPGLTRNARDFEPVAERYAGRHRMIAVDFRGRGLSDYDPQPARYGPPTYAADVLKLLDQLGIADAIFIGTSLGGLVTMLMALNDADRIAGALLNDIGPELDTGGVSRIAGYVGHEARFDTLEQAVSTIAERNADIYPDYSSTDWTRFARRLLRAEAGVHRFDYDVRIAENFAAPSQQQPATIWPLFEALEGRPVTVLRGELSDLLPAAVAKRMTREISDCELVTVPRVGHAPSFDEPESIAALDRLVDRVAAAQC